MVLTPHASKKGLQSMNGDKNTLKTLRLPLIAAGLLTASLLPQGQLAAGSDPCLDAVFACEEQNCMQGSCASDPVCQLQCISDCYKSMCACEIAEGNGGSSFCYGC